MKLYIHKIHFNVLFIALIISPLAINAKEKPIKITILYTNDVHSRVDAYPLNDNKYPGMGGFARRAAIVKKIRSEEKNVLLFDAGDFSQGTPYFNKFYGEVELRLMSEIGYNAAAIGNHEFDNGLEKLSNVLKFANFPLINSNYDFSNTPLKDKVLPYKIFEMEGVKIGVFGLGVELAGLVSPDKYGKTIYHDAAEVAAKTTFLLKNDFKCDLIVCLSHLGLKYENDLISDMSLAKQSKNIDVIIGGHSHTPIDKPYRIRNSDNKEIIICQVGSGGVKLGRLDFYFEKKTKLKL